MFFLAVAERQMEYHGTVATVLWDKLLRVVAWIVVSYAIPFVAVAGMFWPFRFGGRVYGEVQHYDAVALMLWWEMLCVVAAGAVGDFVPNVSVAGLGTPFIVDHFVVDGQM